MIEIYVNDLEKAAKQAGKAAAQCTDYAKTLEKKVLHGINNYSGGNTANMSAAQRSINAKRSALAKKAQSFTDYQRKLTNFKDKVVNIENRLYGKITSLYGRFEKEYGISSEETTWEKILGFLWGDKAKEWFRSFKNKAQSIKERMRNWYKYQGGKEIIKAVLSIGAAILAAIGAFASIATGFWLVTVAAAILAIIATANAIVQVVYYTEAIGYAASGVTHMAGRQLMHGDKETFTSWLKRQGAYTAAKIVNVVSAVCNAITIINSLVDFGKKFFGNQPGTFFTGVKQRLQAIFGPNKAPGISGWDAAKGVLKRTYEYATKGKTFKFAVGLAETSLKTVNGLLDVKFDGIIDMGVKYVANNLLGIQIGSYDAKKGTISRSLFNPLSDAIGIYKSGVKLADAIIDLRTNKTVYNFSYEKNAGQIASKHPAGNYKLESFTSIGKFVTTSVSNLTDWLSSFKAPKLTTPVLVATA